MWSTKPERGGMLVPAAWPCDRTTVAPFTAIAPLPHRWHQSSLGEETNIGIALILVDEMSRFPDDPANLCCACKGLAGCSEPARLLLVASLCCADTESARCAARQLPCCMGRRTPLASRHTMRVIALLYGLYFALSTTGFLCHCSRNIKCENTTIWEEGGGCFHLVHIADSSRRWLGEMSLPTTTARRTPETVNWASGRQCCSSSR